MGATPPFEEFAGIGYDGWMNLSAGVGVTLLFVSMWIAVRGWIPTPSPALAGARRLGYVLIAVPLFSRWYLSASLLFSIGVTMAAVAACTLLLRATR